MSRPILATPLQLALVSTAIAVLGGCTTLGGNVKGSFSCAAPNGICAPSASIDDRALAMIAGEGDAQTGAPVGPAVDPGARRRQPRTVASGPRTPTAAYEPGRTQERVLRIVFQPYIDDYGRLHEASAVHAVVAGGAWRPQVLMGATILPVPAAGVAAASNNSLAEAVDRADPSGGGQLAYDPNLPDPAVVAAARARAPAPDPIAAIKSDVAARLVRKSGRGARGVVSKSNAQAVSQARATGPTGAPVPAKLSANGAAGENATASKSATTSPFPNAARSGTGAPPPPPAGAAPASKAPVRAAGFPGVVPEDR